ncbi:peptidase [Streptococcus sp. X16XC17]|uniref:cell wall elongation regulator TseB-like domain-containing protein n=1 Tax=Streptococcus sp. X16XC17 TaxID=2316646 RepID=UPI00066FBFB4|nr:DUF5590 domain-containing protein [Streptococcus sp. X16XC17]TCD46197.1 peptidase [Streptococcus sp. X16XC17]
MFIGCLIILIVVLFSFFFILEETAKPFQEAENVAVTIAKQYVDLNDIIQVEIYNGSQTYYSVIGRNQDGQELLVLVPQQSSDIYVYDMANGISKEKAEQIAKENGADQVEKSTLGYEKNRAIWEVKAGRTYYLIDFETSQLLEKEGI